MNNTLEIRSTFRPSENLPDKTKSNANNILFRSKQNSNSSSKNLHQQKNAAAVANDYVKKIKSCLDHEMKSMLEPYVTTKLTSVIRKQFNGQEYLELNLNNKDLLGFELASIKNTCNRFKNKCFIRTGSQKGDIIFDLPGFIPSMQLDAPKEATNFKISSKLIALSSFKINNDKEAYTPVNEALHGLNTGYESSMLPLIKIQTQPITAKLYIDKLKANAANFNTVMILAIKYYKYDQGKFQHLNKSGCMSILRIF